MIKNNPIYQMQNLHRYNLRAHCELIKPKVIDLTNNFTYGELQTLLIEQKIGKLLSDLIEVLRKELLNDIEEIIDKTIIHYNKLIKEEFNATLGRQEINKLTSEILRTFASQFYKGMIFDNRIDKIKKNALLKIGARLRDKSIEEELWKSIYKQIDSIYGSLETLMISEENRIYHETTLAFFDLIGVRGARFCLTPQHETTDICDELALAVDITLKPILKAKGLKPEGVYRISDFPDYPHPRAFYYIEPIFELGFNPFYLRKD